MKRFYKWILLMIVFTSHLCFISCEKKSQQVNNAHKNILFISIDDLRPELGSYGNNLISSPNLDKLAAQGMQFNHAYCQQALCVPSRSSVLTGLRPSSAGVKYFAQHFRNKHPDLTTLPQVFQSLGYKVNGVGKVFHHRDTLSWDERVWVPEPDSVYPMYYKEENKVTQARVIENGEAMKKDPKIWWAKGNYWVPAHSWESADVHDTTYFDGKITNKAIEYMRKYQADPFFLAVGFFRPHIPFVAPQKYFDLYTLDKISLPADTFPPENVPDIALHNWGETRRYTDIPEKGSITSSKKKELLRGYYACISYIDAQIGRLVDELEALGIAENTMIVLWSDHGYHLGDLGLWGKYSNFEQATRSPFIIHVPWVDLKTHHTDAVVELLDIYPTVLDFLDLKPPGHLEGKSLKSLWSQNDERTDLLAFSEYTKSGYTGYSVRSKNYRYTYWRPHREKSEQFELYDYQPGGIEKTNVANHSDYQAIREKLHAEILKEYKLNNDQI